MLRYLETVANTPTLRPACRYRCCRMSPALSGAHCNASMTTAHWCLLLQVLPAVFYFIGRSLSATPAQLGTLTLCRALVQVSLHAHCWLCLCIALQLVSRTGRAEPSSAQGATVARLSLDGLVVWCCGMLRSLLSALLYGLGAGRESSPRVPRAGASQPACMGQDCHGG